MFTRFIRFFEDLRALREALYGKKYPGEGTRACIKLGRFSTVNELSLSPNGEYLACAIGYWSKGETEPGGLVLCSIPKQQPVKIIREDPLKVLSVAFSPTGRFLAYGTGGVIRNKKGYIEQRQGRVKILHFSPENQLLTSELWSLVRFVTISPDEKLVACGTSDCLVIIFDAETLEKVHILPHGDCVCAVAFSPCGTRLAVARCEYSRVRAVRSWIEIWDTGSWQLKGTVHGRGDEPYSMAFCEGGAALTAGYGDGTLEVTNVDSGACRWTVKCEGEGMRILATTRSTVLTLSPVSRRIRLWNLAGGNEEARIRLLISRWHPFGLTAEAAELQGEVVATAESPAFIGFFGSLVRVWNLSQWLAEVKQSIRE